MKPTYLVWLATSLLALPATTQAQTTSASLPLTAGGATSQPTAIASTPRAILGGPPQPVITVTEPSERADLALLRQLPLLSDGQLLPAELARIFPQGVRPLVGFRQDIAAVATATAVAGSRTLVALALPPHLPGVPASGAAPGQRLKLLTASGEQVVAVARPAAAGSHVLVVSAQPSLAGRPVFVVGLEHTAEQAIDYQVLALLSLGATQQLAQQLATVQQQVAALRSQLTAAQQVTSALLLDHAEQESLKQRLNLLLSQQAAAFSAAHQGRGISWLAD